MDGLDHFDDDTAGTVFRDVILLALIGFMAMLIMLLPHITPPQENIQDHKAPGNVIVEMHWPSNLSYDVDLWVKAPDELPVGFWNQSGTTFNLLRDDLGEEGDATEENYEVTYSRGIPAGEYIVNVHMYGRIPPNTEIPVKVVVSVKRPLQDTEQLLATTVKVSRPNEEKTAYRFRLDADARLIEDSVSTLQRPLITEFSRR